ncbi:MAG: bifunctional (p)ppGpp synthetase/guanosine-3',5'-bis(diphosphate) 3'-pyrophosphohydrolase [Chloroflexi bacterium]|nr:bifunctional (p)ppGpp synthetase/guanosine-3',5'-bis(diphosphate) 3'-pyrophosphohydrolase [Chloroflexota bacterium]
MTSEFTPGDRQNFLKQVEALYPDALNEVSRALDFAVKAHGNQLRQSGDLYIMHPIEVAVILLDLHMDIPTIIASLLHDTVEDTTVTLADIKLEFGPIVARLVDGVSKLQHVKEKSHLDRATLSEVQAENLRKMFLAMVDDIRVIIIKLADRLHNMRTLQFLAEDRQKRMAQETLDIYAPLANRLGIWQLKWQLEDLSFRYLDDEAYHRIAQLVAEKREERAAYLEQVIDILKKRLVEEGITARITGRPKHLYSIYHKMQEKNRDFDQIYDVRGVRIIVLDIPACYHALGIVHSLWRPIPGEFDDYIASPKENFYQSLHTAVVALQGKPLEVQIRTEKMHQVAEYGIAAHWRYKDGGAHRDESLETKIAWLQRNTDWREDVEDAHQFVEGMRSDVFAERVYVFTPKGDIVDLPKGSTPVDFAYDIHSEIGHRCRGAKVDGRLVALDYQLKNGEQVEILTAKQGGPSRDWLNPHLNYVSTQKARQKIRQWFRHEKREENIAAGREILDRELRRLGFDQESYTEIATLFNFSKLEDFLAEVGFGSISPSQIAAKIDEPGSDKNQALKLKAIPESAVSEVTVAGVGDLYTRMGNCCSPVPGDAIVGYITRGKGITVHRQDCPNVINMRDTERLIPLSWGRTAQAYPVVIRIEAFDRSGLLRDITSVMADLNINMSAANINTGADHTANIVATVGIRSITQLSDLITKLLNVRDVLEVRRERTN